MLEEVKYIAQVHLTHNWGKVALSLTYFSNILA